MAFQDSLSSGYQRSQIFIYIYLMHKQSCRRVSDNKQCQHQWDTGTKAFSMPLSNKCNKIMVTLTDPFLLGLEVNFSPPVTHCNKWNHTQHKNTNHVTSTSHSIDWSLSIHSCCTGEITAYYWKREQSLLTKQQKCINIQKCSLYACYWQNVVIITQHNWQKIIKSDILPSSTLTLSRRDDR